MAKVSQRQIVAQVKQHNPPATNAKHWYTEARPYFAQVSGGEIQSSVEKVYDGGKTFPEVIPAPLEIGDISVTRHFDPEDIDADRLEYYRSRVGRARFDVDVYTTDADGMKIGLTRQYQNVLLVNLTEPEGDASAGGPAMFSLTFAVSDITTSNPLGTTGLLSSI